MVLGKVYTFRILRNILFQAQIKLDNKSAKFAYVQLYCDYWVILLNKLFQVCK